MAADMAGRWGGAGGRRSPEAYIKAKGEAGGQKKRGSEGRKKKNKIKEKKKRNWKSSPPPRTARHRGGRPRGRAPCSRASWIRAAPGSRVPASLAISSPRRAGSRGGGGAGGEWKGGGKGKTNKQTRRQLRPAGRALAKLSGERAGGRPLSSSGPDPPPARLGPLPPASLAPRPPQSGSPRRARCHRPDCPAPRRPGRLFPPPRSPAVLFHTPLLRLQPLPGAPRASAVMLPPAAPPRPASGSATPDKRSEAEGKEGKAPTGREGARGAAVAAGWLTAPRSQWRERFVEAPPSKPEGGEAGTRSAWLTAESSNRQRVAGRAGFP